jgi:hypothetical protein
MELTVRTGLKVELCGVRGVYFFANAFNLLRKRRYSHNGELQCGGGVYLGNNQQQTCAENRLCRSLQATILPKEPRSCGASQNQSTFARQDQSTGV